MKKILTGTLSEHIEALNKKEYSSKELTLAYLDEIEEKNKLLNAYVTVNAKKALILAEESDKRRHNGALLSTIDGIPYASKDNISTKGIRTTCASKILENYIPPYDATAIEILSKSGAVLLGKTNLDEFAMGISTETSYFGVTSNPINTDFVSGGSGGGSAAAVAASTCAFALGSDTGGSVRQPAAFCGVVGMRPTYGGISRYGLISFAPSLDQIGTVTANVADNALITSLLLRHDKRDETSARYPETNFLGEIGKGVKGSKVAVLKDSLKHELSPAVKNAVFKSVDILASLGCEIVEIDLPHADSAYAAYYVISCAESSSNLARFDGVRYGYRAQGYSDVEELYRLSRSEGFGDEVKRRILFGTMVLSSEYRNDFYARAQNMRSVIANELTSALQNVDALLLPTAPTAAYKKGEAARIGFEAGIDDIFCTLASLAGLPALSLPCNNRDGMPVGIQLVGKAFGEATLYRIAATLEAELSGGEING